MPKLLRKLISSQQLLSHTFDRVLPARFRLDGRSDFTESIVPGFLRANMTVYDVGAGKAPLIDPMTKARLNLLVVGLDIDQKELDRAPTDAYDKAICADICQYRGYADADLVICQTLLEHVPNVEEAFISISTILKPHGVALIFVPSRNALFARLNFLLPERVKRKLLFSIYPQSQEKQGFPAYYDRCTPKDFRAIATRCGLAIESRQLYFMSAYFSFLFPAYLLWRIWILGFYALCGEQAAETFWIAVRK